MTHKPLYYLLFLIVGTIIILLLFPPINSPLIVETRPSKLVLFNNTTDTLQYAVFERSASRLAQWKPCDHPDLCANQGINPGVTQRIPYEAIYHWYPGAEVVVYWWRLVPDSAADNGYAIDGPYDVSVVTPNRPMLGM